VNNNNIIPIIFSGKIMVHAEPAQIVLNINFSVDKKMIF
jgi:hypothetical protein